MEFPSYAACAKPSQCYIAAGTAVGVNCRLLLGNFSCYLVPLEVTVTKKNADTGDCVKAFIWLQSRYFVLQAMHV